MLMVEYHSCLWRPSKLLHSGYWASCQGWSSDLAYDNRCRAETPHNQSASWRNLDGYWEAYGNLGILCSHSDGVFQNWWILFYALNLGGSRGNLKMFQKSGRESGDGHTRYSKKWPKFSKGTGTPRDSTRLRRGGGGCKVHPLLKSKKRNKFWLSMR